jgi:cell division protein FtsI/penicillin-binding protein 2
MCPIGEVNLNSAMATSSNSYFLEIMTRFPFEDWYTFARSVGFGKKTGIELPVKTENADNNKKPELNDFYHKIESIREVEGDFIFNNELSRLMCAIGLGPDIKITPIQFAVFLASLFNGGKIMKPVFKGQNPVVITNYSLPKNIDLILSSLKETTLTGTGRGFEIPDASEIYSKSGSTMQHTTPYKPNGWFVGVVKAKNQYIGFVSFTPDRTSQTPKHIIASLLRSYIQNSIKSRD